ncbi:L,D-transpeptidase [Acidipropionibacterium timonense]|uniref:L,D-transpeptidase n=1 Tax=Acidipropionibacterium timonense TaxID=2161818 RepID=UPI001FD92E89|nr:L,D-transpeptidase [Acidipropionibacterium timonense]
MRGPARLRRSGSRALAVTLILPLVGCATAGLSATPSSCLDAVPGAGDARARSLVGTEACQAGPAGPSTAAAARQAGMAVDPPAATASAPVAAPGGPSVAAVPAASLAVGEPSSAGRGTYVLWIKAENHVYLVRSGRVARVMATTGLPWKTPVGDYKVQYKERKAASFEDGVHWTLPYFIAFYRRPGASGDIAFHQIPTDPRGAPAQTVASLGQPGLASHGCARLAPADARAVWDFTREGTQVRVR